MKAEIKDYINALNEIHNDLSKSTDPYERRRHAAAMTILADQLMIALSPIINEGIVQVEDYTPSPTPMMSAKIYEFKKKE